MMQKNPSSIWYIAFVALAIAIFNLSIFGRVFQTWVRENLGDTFLGWAVGIVLTGAVIGAILWVRRYGDIREAWRFLAFLPIIAWITWHYELPEERLHFIYFGLLGFLSWKIFAKNRAFFWCFAISAGDEILQKYLPERYGTIWDTLMNISACLLGILMAYWLQKAQDPAKMKKQA